MTFEALMKLISDEKTVNKVLRLVQDYITPLLCLSMVSVLIGSWILVDTNKAGDVVLAVVCVSTHACMLGASMMAESILRKRRDALAMMRRMSTIANATPRRTH